MKTLKISSLVILVFILILNGKINAQGEVYATSAAEMIFSWSNITIDGVEPTAPLRWSPVFNFGTLLHYDMDNNRIGLFSGLAVRNVGLIFNDPNDNGNLHIHRTYNLGIPIALKLGDFTKGFLYGGYEFEFPFNYKHKYWDSSERSGAKTKQVEWFAGPVKTQQAWFAGIQFSGVNVKFKYYITNFFDKNYTESGIPPYDGYDANILYISLTANMLRGAKFYDY